MHDFRVFLETTTVPYTWSVWSKWNGSSAEKWLKRNINQKNKFTQSEYKQVVTQRVNQPRNYGTKKNKGNFPATDVTNRDAVALQPGDMRYELPKTYCDQNLPVKHPGVGSNKCALVTVLLWNWYLIRMQMQLSVCGFFFFIEKSRQADPATSGAQDNVQRTALLGSWI